VGSDRLGIVSDMTKYVTDVRGNVGDSQAARLGSNFSLMMLVEIPESQIEVLKESLKNMQDMNATIHEATVDAAARTPQIAYSGKFKLSGADHPGIVNKVTTILTQNGLSIDKMETSESIAPYGGTMLFKMRGIATAAAPLAANFDIQKVKTELSDLGDSMNCDIALVDVADDEYQGSFYAG